MSESMKHGGEHTVEKLDLETESKNNLNKLREKAEKAHESTPEEVQAIKSKVETQAVSGKEFTIGEKENTSHGHQHVNQKKLKSDSYKRTMQSVRKKLSKPNQTFSKVIHNKTVENLSEIGSSTIARPSGILGGGIVALVGSGFLLYMAREYGFEYNYFVFFLLFVGGFFVGMVGELLVRSVFRKS